MSIRTLRFLFILFCSIFLVSASRIASSVILDLDKDLGLEQPSLETLLHLTDTATTSRSDAEKINTPAQATLAIRLLEMRLRRSGDIGAIANLSTRIIELAPDQPRILYLYALALAAQGKVDQASDLLSKREPSEADSLYALLAESAIAKAKGKLPEAYETAKLAIDLEPDHPYAYNILGQIAVMQEKYSDAIESFSKAIQKAPEFVAALSNLGAVQLIQADTASAWRSYSKALAVTSGFCPALLGRATLAIQLGNKPRAIKDLETCLQNDPGQPEARQRLITLCMQQGQLDKAKSLIEQNEVLDPAFVQTTLGEIALRNNEPAAARDSLNRIDPADAQTHYLIAFSYAMEHRFEEALHSIDRAASGQPDTPTLTFARQVIAFSAGKPIDRESLLKLRTDPGLGAPALFLLGNIAASQDDFQAAFDYWSSARDLLPGFILSGLSPDEMRAASSDDEQKPVSLGMLFYLKGYYAAARAEFDKALSLNGDSFMANFLSALTLAQTGKSDAALPYLLRSVERTPEFFPANYMLAEHYLKTGDIARAITYYRAAANSDPDQGVLIKLGLLYQGLGDMEAAEQVYRTFIAHHAESFLGYNQLAWLYAKQGTRLNEALELARQADNLRPDNASVNDTLGWIYFQRQDYPRALEFLSKANAISKGKNPDILFHLAAVKVKQEDLSQAQSYLEQALAISDQFESVDQAKALLASIRDTD